MTEEIKVPEIGENVESGEVVSVLVAAGDTIEVDDVVIELETDKATVEIPSPYKGKISEVLVREGDTVKIGDVIAKVDTDAGADEEEKKREGQKGEKPDGEGPEEETAEEEEPEKAEEKKEPEAGEPKAEDKKKTARPPAGGEDDGSGGEAPEAEDEDKGGRRRRPPEKEQAPDEDMDSFSEIPAAPSVRRLARELGVDLRKVKGSAPGGRISENDVKAYVKKDTPAAGAPTKTAAPAAPDLPDFSQWGEIETVELPKVRRLTAESTAVSWQQIPHVTQHDRADVTELNAFIEKNAETVRKSGGKLTVTAILAKICAEALKKFPRFNASIDPANQRLVLKKYVHIGIMVATDRGLLVPVIPDADRKNLTELAAAVSDLADRSRNKKIKPDEMQGGSFSISNQGGIGGTAFTPIVLWPQVAILGVSRSSTEPVYRNGDLSPREILPLSLSYDHRVVDGADAARFLRWICESLEQPLNMFLQ